MNWQVFSRPEAENDVIEIAAWYDSRREGLGDRFVEEFLLVLDELSTNPLLYCRRHPYKNIRGDIQRELPLSGDLRGPGEGEDCGRSCCATRRKA